MGLDAPDQLIHGHQHGLPLRRRHPVLEAREHQHLAPGLLQQAHHGLRQGLAQQALVQGQLHLLTRHFGLCPPFFGIAGTLLQQVTATALVAGKSNKLGQQLGENGRVISKIIQQALHNLIDTLIQGVALGIILINPTQRRRGNFIEQTPSRMTATTEEGLIQHRHFQHRNLQACNQGFQRIRQGAVVEDKLEQHRHQVDNVLIHLAHHTRLTTLGAGAAEQRLQLIAQVKLVSGGRRLPRQALLNMRQ